MTVAPFTVGVPAWMLSPSEVSSTSSKVRVEPGSASKRGRRTVFPVSALNCFPWARKIAYMRQVASLGARKFKQGARFGQVRPPRRGSRSTLLDHRLQPPEPVIPLRRDPGQPVAGVVEAAWLDPPHPFPPPALAPGQAGPGQHLEVFGHRLAGDRLALGEVHDGGRTARTQAVDQPEPGSVSQGGEDPRRPGEGRRRAGRPSGPGRHTWQWPPAGGSSPSHCPGTRPRDATPAGARTPTRPG